MKSHTIFSLTEQLCTPYCQLLLNDFSASFLSEGFFLYSEADGTEFEEKLKIFHEGLENNQLVISGNENDLGGYLAIYLEAYFESDDYSHPFHDWESLSSDEKEAVRLDVLRLEPKLKKILFNLRCDID
ncbi:hypothetical protein [Pseudomonas extremaustralis]